MGALQTKNPKTDPNTEICAHLRFSVPIFFGHLIDIKMYSHKLFGQHDQNNMICTQFGFRAFRHGNSFISRVSVLFLSGRPIDTKIILNESLFQHNQNDVSCT
jgi:hypothetical protein